MQPPICLLNKPPYASHVRPYPSNSRLFPFSRELSGAVLQGQLCIIHRKGGSPDCQIWNFARHVSRVCWRDGPCPDFRSSFVCPGIQSPLHHSCRRLELCRPSISTDSPQPHPSHVAHSQPRLHRHWFSRLTSCSLTYASHVLHKPCLLSTSSRTRLFLSLDQQTCALPLVSSADVRHLHPPRHLNIGSLSPVYV